MLIYSKEWPYSCPSWNKRFTQNITLKRHMQFKCKCCRNIRSSGSNFWCEWFWVVAQLCYRYFTCFLNFDLEGQWACLKCEVWWHWNRSWTFRSFKNLNLASIDKLVILLNRHLLYQCHQILYLEQGFLFWIRFLKYIQMSEL